MGHCNECGELLGWFHKTEGLAGPVVHQSSDLREIGSAVLGKVSSTGKELAEQPIGVLVGAALPRRVRVAEVDLDAGVDLDLLVAGHLLAAVPGEGLEQLGWHDADGLFHGPFDLDGLMPVGKVEQHDVASGALDQGADRGAVVGPADQITLPVARHRSVRDLGRTL